MNHPRICISRRVLGGMALSWLATGYLSNVAAASEAADLSPGTKALYEAALKEGPAVTFYTSFAAPEVVEGFKKLFEDRFPGLKMTVYLDNTNRVIQRLRSEIGAGIKEADVISVSGWSLIDDLKKDDLLLKYTPEGIEAVIDSYRDIDPDGYYYTGSVGHNAIAYNTGLVSDEEAPKSWKDLLDPKWKGQIATGHPGASGTVGAWAVQMYLAYGEDYLTQLAAQRVLVGQSIFDVQARLVSGERKVGVVSDLGTLPLVKKGEPIKLVYPTDGAVVIRTPIAILKDAPHSSAAKLLLNWQYSKEVADYYVANGLVPLIKGVSVPEYMTTPDAIGAVTPSLEALSENNKKVVEFWRRAFGA